MRILLLLLAVVGCTHTPSSLFHLPPSPRGPEGERWFVWVPSGLGGPDALVAHLPPHSSRLELIPFIQYRRRDAADTVWLKFLEPCKERGTGTYNTFTFDACTTIKVLPVTQSDSIRAVIDDLVRIADLVPIPESQLIFCTDASEWRIFTRRTNQIVEQKAREIGPGCGSGSAEGAALEGRIWTLFQELLWLHHKPDG
jgi:hypothetical protein